MIGHPVALLAALYLECVALLSYLKNDTVSKEARRGCGEGIACTYTTTPRAAKLS